MKAVQYFADENQAAQRCQYQHVDKRQVGSFVRIGTNFCFIEKNLVIENPVEDFNGNLPGFAHCVSFFGLSPVL